MKINTIIHIVLTPITFLWKRFLSLSIKKKILAIVGLIVIVGGCSYVFKSKNGNGGYIIEPVKRASIQETVSDSGKIISGGNVIIASPTKGFIEELFVENGQVVKENDKLFTVKSSATAQEQETAYSAYMAALAAQKASEGLAHSLRSAMYTEWDTFVDLATNDTYEKSDGTPDVKKREEPEFITTQEDWLAAERKVIDQDTTVAANRAAVASAWTAYQTTQTTTVTAQIAGTVENLSVSLGNSVSTPSVLTPNASPILSIVTNTTPEAMIAVGQTNIAKIKIGQKVVIHPDAYKDKEYEGSIIRLDALGTNTSGVITYNVYIQLKNSDEFIKPEMTIDGDIITNEKTDVLSVPNSAVVLYKGNKAVRIKKGNSVDYLPVKIGAKGESRTEIVEGLSEGQMIIVALTNEKVERKNPLGI